MDNSLANIPESSNNEIIIQNPRLPAIQDVPALIASAINRGVDPEKVRSAANHLKTLEHGAYAATPLYCKGSSCIYKAVCPLLELGMENEIVGKPCPIEAHQMNLWYTEMASSLKIDESNAIESSLVKELARLEIYNQRIANRLSFEDFIQKQAVGIDDEGNVKYRDELHQAVEWDDKLSKRRLKLLEALLATRKSIADAGGGLDASDPSSAASKLMQSIKLASKRQQTKLAEDARANQAKKIN